MKLLVGGATDGGIQRHDGGDVQLRWWRDRRWCYFWLIAQRQMVVLQMVEYQKTVLVKLLVVKLLVVHVGDPDGGDVTDCIDPDTDGGETVDGGTTDGGDVTD